MDQRFIEGYILQRIKSRYGTEDKASEIADRINTSLKNYDGIKNLNRLKRQIEENDNKMRNLIKAIADGLDMSLAKPEIDALKAEKERLELSLNESREITQCMPKLVTSTEILEVFFEA